MAHKQQPSYRGLIVQLAEQVELRPDMALENLGQLLKQRRNDPNLLHFQGLALARLDRHREAVTSMELSLQVLPDQVEILNNLGNSLRALGDLAQAETRYLDALKLKPNFVDPLKHLALLKLQSGEYEEASALIKRALELAPDNVSLHTIAGDIERGRNDFAEAAQHYRSALTLKPDHVPALHNLGLCLKLDERPAEGRPYLNKARELAPHRAEIDVNLGNVAFELDEYAEAERCYLAALGKSPGYLLAHESLAELRWQLGEEGRHTESFIAALKTRPADIELRLSLIRILLDSKQFDAARHWIDGSLKRMKTPELLHFSAALHTNLLDYERAKADFEAAIALRASADMQRDFARLLIMTGDYRRALDQLYALRDAAPYDQLNWALIGTCWRLLEDGRYHWLLDYQRDVRTFMLSTPSEYAQLSDFLEELRALLLTMHSTRRAPMRQTLVSGTQTPGRLLHKPLTLIQTYRRLLAEAVQDYIASMPNDSTHPLYSRKTNNFEFSGSWSVRLLSGGYHVNHVHPEGWISSACYIHLPNSMDCSSDNEGCIKFGESPLGLGEREVIERIIRPKAGQLVLFPSYAWHGTFDFSAEPEDFRLTAPFDVIPVED